MAMRAFHGRGLKDEEAKRVSGNTRGQRGYDFVARGVGVVGVLVVGAIAVALVWYATVAFSGASIAGSVSSLVNAGQQISGAANFFRADHARNPASIEDLLENAAYLLRRPHPPAVASGAWSISGDGSIAYLRLAEGHTRQVCAEVSGRRGYDGSGSPFNASEAADVLQGRAVSFGCIGDFFVYRLTSG